MEEGEGKGVDRTLAQLLTGEAVLPFLLDLHAVHALSRDYQGLGYPQTQGPFGSITQCVDSRSVLLPKLAQPSLTGARGGEEARLFHLGLPGQESVSCLYQGPCTPLPGAALG